MTPDRRVPHHTDPHRFRLDTDGMELRSVFDAPDADVSAHDEVMSWKDELQATASASD